MHKIYYVIVEPDWVDDSGVAFQRDQENAVRRRNQEIPQWESCKPNTTNELVVTAVTWHTGAIHLDNGGQQSEERCTHVDDALIYDQDVHRLNKHA